MTLIATHNGPFHADDVMAVALLRTFWCAEAEVVRSRDPQVLDGADAVVDVGGVFDPDLKRFDHHQASYTGPRSSAGMVLDWLDAQGSIDPGLAFALRKGCIDYVDAVDNGRTAPDATVPCFARMVDALNQPASDLAAFDVAFEGAARLAASLLDGWRAEHDNFAHAKSVVNKAMESAELDGRNVLFFDEYVSWKRPYFELGGAVHDTEFVLFPGTDDSWRIIAIPPKLGAFEQKRSLPEEWAGLTDEALEEVTGIPGAVFCHKNRFIAVFKTRAGAMRALLEAGLLYR